MLYQTLEHAQGFSWASWFSWINMYQIRICIDAINIYRETNSKINMFMALVHILKFKNFYFVDATSFNISSVIKQSITVFTSTILSSNFWWTNGSFCSNVSMNNLKMGKILMHKLRWSSFLLHIWSNFLVILVFLCRSSFINFLFFHLRVMSSIQTLASSDRLMMIAWHSSIS